MIPSRHETDAKHNGKTEPQITQISQFQNFGVRCRVPNPVRHEPHRNDRPLRASRAVPGTKWNRRYPACASSRTWTPPTSNLCNLCNLWFRIYVVMYNDPCATLTPSRRGRRRTVKRRMRGKEERQPSISRVLFPPEPSRRAATISLGTPLPAHSSILPGDSAGRVVTPCLDLLRMGFAMPALSPGPRWALTLRPQPPPFHPCL